ncbi:hypothetical protein [Corallococcus sp. AB030]|uniref:hypothetical protein n=1 Tax=Corallococcus sp. AB030 TaxID=2316716 RepID=UPI0011E58BE1|nr:hypothetical protein [Corallococcus sp. AB030]
MNLSLRTDITTIHIAPIAPMPTSPKSIITNTIPLEFKLEADFATPETHIYTSPTPPEHDRETFGNAETPETHTPNGYLIIDSQIELDKIDSISESARHFRPRYLSLLGAITFLTGEPLTPLDTISTSARATNTPLTPYTSKSKLISESGDHSKSLSTLFSTTTNTPPGAKLLTTSLLDRWRKARWMQEREESHLYADEAFLSYFHILELLAKEHNKSLTESINKEIDLFITKLLSKNLKHRGPRLQQLKGEKTKSVKLAVAEHIPVASRICHFLEHLGMLNVKSQELVENLIEIRNSIAHGRQVYQDRMMWPLTSFFPLSADSLDYLPAIQVLTARSISKHLKISTWDLEWRQLVRRLPPPDDIVRAFIKDKGYSQLSDGDFLSGRRHGVTPSVISGLYLSKKIKFGDLESSLCDLMTRTQPSRRTITELLMAAYILSDSTNQQLASSAQSFVLKVHDSLKGGSLFIPKDTLRHLEHLGFAPIWMRQWIEDK